MNKVISDEERLAWLHLIRCDGIGPQTFFSLLKRYGSASAALEELPDLIQSGAAKRISLCQRQSVEEEYGRAERQGVKWLAACEPGYPQTLRSIPDPPPLISVLGDTSLLVRNGIAIVGARNASIMGRRMAAELARGLGKHEFVVHSGMARGIDGAAHHAALNTGTVAVLAGGVDQVYPPEHRDLYGELIETGAVVSEVRLGQIAKARDFPKRNRIVSGLSRGVIVVEAADRSGTLITARLALEQGREVFAVPGSPLDPRCEGTNELIRNGATLIRNVDDVLEGLGNLAFGVGESGGDEYESGPTPDLDADERQSLRKEICQLLSYTPTPRDYIIRETGAPPSTVADVLLDLLLDGSVSEAAGGFSLSTDES